MKQVSTSNRIVAGTITLILLLSFFRGRAQVDSFELAFPGSRFSTFDVVKYNTPLVPFAEGIFMPNEKLWFFRFKDTLQRLVNFGISRLDTSTYIFCKVRNHVYLSNYKHDIGGDRQVRTDLLTLDTGSYYGVYPIGRLQFYLLVRDSISRIFYCNRARQLEAVTQREPILSVIGLDSNSVVACFAHRLVLFSLDKKKGRVLFRSRQPILSACVLPSGMPFISSSAGVFTVNRDLSMDRLDIDVTDGILKLAGKYLYILSNVKKKIYKMPIS